jgi:PilZ domain
MPEKQKKADDESLRGLIQERRQHRRYEFQAKVEIVDTSHNRSIQAEVSNIGQRGFFVSTPHPFPVGTDVRARIERGSQSAEVVARVVYSSEKQGMGLVFTDIALEQLGVLEEWLGKLREASWFLASRRRSQRVFLKVGVRVCMIPATNPPFEEDTQTLQVSAHGALLTLSRPFDRGQKFLLKNLNTSATQECIVAYTGERHADRFEVALEFSRPSPHFWNIRFPPEDWKPQSRSD